jgi:pimeloyl-ACP methyl ester carboxylesterase
MTVASLPGYGQPAKASHDLAPRALARTLVQEWMSSPGDYLLLAHSASCQVVVEAALLAPDRVRGVVLVGPTTDPRAASWLRLVRRWAATALYEPPSQLPTLVRLYRRTRLATMARAMDRARRHRIDLALPAVTCPVLLVRGRHDHIAPPDWLSCLRDHGLAPADEAGDASGPARVTVTLASGGHMVPLTRGRLLAAEVLCFAKNYLGGYEDLRHS